MKSETKIITMRHDIEYSEIMKNFKSGKFDLSEVYSVMKYFNDDIDVDRENKEKAIKEYYKDCDSVAFSDKTSIGSKYLESGYDCFLPGYYRTILVADEILRHKRSIIRSVVSIIVVAVLAIIFAIILNVKNVDPVVTYDSDSKKVVMLKSGHTNDMITVEGQKYILGDSALDTEQMNRINQKISENIGGPSVSLIILEASNLKEGVFVNRTLSDEEVYAESLKTAKSILYNKTGSHSLATLIYMKGIDRYAILSDVFNNKKYEYFKTIPYNGESSSSGLSTDEEVAMLDKLLQSDILGSDVAETYSNLVDYVRSNIDMDELGKDVVSEIEEGRVCEWIIISLLLVMPSLIAAGMILVAYLESGLKFYRDDFDLAVDLVDEYDSAMSYKYKDDGDLIKLKDKEHKHKGNDDVEDKDYDAIEEYDNDSAIKTLNKIRTGLKALNKQLCSGKDDKEQNGRNSDATKKFNKVIKIVDTLSNELKDSSDKNTSSKIQWFCRRYGKLIIDSIDAVSSLDSAIKREEKATELLDYLSKSLEKICDVRNSNKESKADITIETLGNLMRLDGQL